MASESSQPQSSRGTPSGGTPSGGSPSEEFRKLSHDMKNALHGASVNLEVARSRAARGVIDAEQLVPFLDSAAQQIEAATALYKQVSERCAAWAATSHP